MMVRRGSLPLVLALVMLGSNVRADDAENTYLAVRDEVSRFREDAHARKFRHNYAKLIEKLRAVAIEHPSSSRADDALYVAAQLFDELYQVSLVGRDLEDALAAYEEMAARHPDSNLADDALFRAARLRLEKLGDREGARRLLERVTAMRGADFRPQASELLARLPPEPAGEIDAPAPDVGTSPDVTALLKRVEAEIEAEGGSVTVDGIEAHGDTTTVEAAPTTASTTPGPDGPTAEVHPAPTGGAVAARRVVAVQPEKAKDASVVRVRLSDAVGVRRGEIAAQGDVPRRVFYELTPVRLGKQAMKPIDVKSGPVRRVRVGQFSEDTVRVVMEIDGDSEPVVDVKKRPFELTFTVAPKAPATAAPPVVASATPAKPAAPAVAEVRARVGTSGAPGGVSLSEQMGLKVRRVVIDAGHGGHDTGAIGPTGVKEKDVTLAIAKRVKKRIEERVPGVEVILTRDDDRFLELAERTAIANSAGADLFISIHANANPSRKVRGIETYYLNITSDRYAIRLAQRENSEHEGAQSIGDLEFILADLAMKSNVDDSIRLGRHVQGAVVSRLRSDYSDVQDLGLKHALFFVLLGSRMPAILVETSFVSNRVEEKRLASNDYQEAVADGVVRGVQRFMEERQAYNAP